MMARSRRMRGTGSYDAIKKDGKITFYRWRLGVFDPICGKTKYVAIKARTRAALDVKVKAWKEEHVNGDEVSPLTAGKRLTVAQWAQRWLASKENKIAQSTLARYRNNTERHLLPRFGRLWIGKVSPLDLQVYFDEMARTYAPQTIKTVRAHFRACFQSAVKFGLIHKNPVMQTEPPRMKAQEPTVLDEADVKKILEVAQKQSYRAPARDDADAYIMRRNYLVVLLAVASGMRQGEVLGLTWGCIHGETLEVKHALQALPGDKRTLKEPKNGKPRNVYIPAAVAVELESWREFQAKYAEKYKGLYDNPLSLVFTGPLGRPTDGGHFTYHHYKAICEAAGVKARFHDLRHFWASSALSRGVSVMAVSAQLGHSGIDITLRRYTHVLERSRDELRQMLDSNPLFVSKKEC